MDVWGLFKFILFLKIYLMHSILGHLQLKKRRGDDVNKQKLKNIILTVVLIGAAVFLCLFLLGTFAQAAGLVDDTVSEDNLYSKYALDHYQLDFYVDTGWDWLPWNWNDGIGNQVMYELYTITNFIWIISLYLSNATGYLIQQAYSLDFISQTADAIGKNMQTLAGITASGFSSSGFYVGFLLLFILIIDRKSTRLNSSHVAISYAVFCLKKKKRKKAEV